MVRPVSATRRRLPGGSFIWPYTIATLSRIGLRRPTRSSRGRSRCLRGYARRRRRTPTDPRARLAMLLISSIMLTVLPTPAPPNRPTLPPLANGHIRSMTLMPVSSRSLPEDWSSYVGAARWISQCVGRLDRTGFVDRLAEHVHDAAQRADADRHRDALAGVVGDQVALEAVGRAERDGAHDAVAELLLHFERDLGVVAPSARRTPSARTRAGIRRRRRRR